MSTLINECSRPGGACKTQNVSVCQVMGLALVLILSPAGARAGSYASIASEVAKAALRHQKKRVAVLPFQGVAGREGSSGQIVSQKLIHHLLSKGGLEVIERTLLAGVIEEQRLGSTGFLQAETVRQLGSILGVEAIVTGTVLPLKNGRIEVNARMIDTGTARVLSSTVGQVEREWSESLFDEFTPYSLPAPSLPSFEAVAPAIDAWRDGLNDSRPGCRNADETLDRWERSILDLKARYWALRLREPNFSFKSLTRNPGSEIHSPITKREFYRKLEEWHERPVLAPLSLKELEQLKDTVLKTQDLAADCRIQL